MKHKHADLIHAWADGAQIQWMSVITGQWADIDMNGEEWYEHYKYRIKPTPKPDFCTYSTITFGNAGQQSTMQYGTDNVKFTYDGETRKLKSAEVI